MRVKIDNAQNLLEYVKWYVSKAMNVPELETRLVGAKAMIERYKNENQDLIVDVKLK